MRFSLIDQITDLKPGESIQTVKSLSIAEEYLQDHFPGFPIMPGVLMVESMVQTCAWLMRASEDFRYSTVVLKEARAVKFNNFVSPGKTLTLTASVQKNEGRFWTLKASGHVGDVNTVSARLIMEQYNLADTEPRRAAADETQVKHLKELFAVLDRTASPVK